MNDELKKTFDRMIDRHFRFEAEDDVDGVLSTMVDDVEHDVVGYPTGPVHGKTAARGFYDTLFADLSGEKVTTLRRYYGADFVVDESLWAGTAPGAPFGIPGHGRKLSFRLLHVFEMAPDGQIKRENVWLDFASILQQLNAPLAS
ncbi:ketosteroid isomerase [Bradyrhizobium nanningense]|uniref:Ketosteroid isomerase n=1 Tax=Bradyrhizobium nanningense TaxID=1325118 RepID=A0A4V1L3B4_9BRAD|nr:nuclear transport factor 2 family protein [Bradyrhizobium nanningense]RXH32393.1 ketosteroid isomerase [Bradyrhizobium nanningense]RXH37383.1 ketosteroid isomerase [Bradyrhizobium nanningense]